MVLRQWITARKLIVTGFSMTFVAAVIEVSWFISVSLPSGQLPVDTWIDEILFPLASLSTVIAWWFLTKISVASTGQDDIFHKAFLAFSLESVLIAVPTGLSLIRYFFASWTELADILYFLGSITAASGFFFIARKYSSKSLKNLDAIMFDRALDEEGDNISFEQLKRELGWS
jgi:hypothetical protein